MACTSVVAAIDIQGFQVEEEFLVKEMTIKTDLKIVGHFFFKPKVEFTHLKQKDQRAVRYLENKHHGLRYCQGYIDYSHINEILRKYLRGVDKIFVKGHQKYNFLKRKIEELGSEYKTIEIVNIEQLLSISQPKFTKSIPKCTNHINDDKYPHPFMCSFSNCEDLYECLKSHAFILKQAIDK